MDLTNSENHLDGLNQIIEDIAERLTPIAAARIGIQYGDFKKRFSLRFESSHVVNAYVKTSDEWKTFEITVNHALMMFYHKMLKVYVSILSVGDKKSGIMEKQKIAPERIISVCKELLKAFWEDRFLTQGGFWLKELGKGQIVVASRLLTSCECFTVAHEMGHVIIGMTKGTVAEYAIARKFVKDFLEHFPELSDHQKLELIEPWTDEICADLIGLQISLAQPNIEPYNRWENYKQWLSNGAEISSLLITMLQEYYDRLNNGSKRDCR